MRNLWQRLRGQSEQHAEPDAGGVPASLDVPEAPAPRLNIDYAPDDVGQKYHRYVLGLPDHTPPKPTQEELNLTRRMQAMRSHFDAGNLPRLPSVLPQIIRALKSDNVGGAQLAELLGRDPILVGEVMRVSHSIFYRTLHPIQSLQHAVVLLGQEGLRRVVSMYLAKPILQASAGMFGHVAGQRLWDHAERCSHACAFLSKGQVDSFEAYVAGMVSNAGTSAVVRTLDHELQTTPGPLTHAFVLGCAKMGRDFTVAAAQHWELSPVVVKALQERAQHAWHNDVSPLGKALLCADQIAMVHVLGQHGLMSPHADLSGAWPDFFAPGQIRRCQEDLRQHFNESEPALS